MLAARTPNWNATADPKGRRLAEICTASSLTQLAAFCKGLYWLQMRQAGNPRTADGAAFRFRAGRLSLDLCSTLLWRHREPTEQLLESGDLARWLHEAGVRPVPTALGDDDLQTARRLREAIYALAHDRLAGRDLSAAHIATVNAVAAHPDPIPGLTDSGQLAWHAAAPASAALSSVARDAIELLCGPYAGRLRECAAPDCAFLFVDMSRPGRRRWCAMNRCGNREHVRDHRRRQRTDSPREDPPTASPGASKLGAAP
jgi:predicted RNA-binding Zn ribbon-like protein